MRISTSASLPTSRFVSIFWTRRDHSFYFLKLLHLQDKNTVDDYWSLASSKASLRTIAACCFLHCKARPSLIAVVGAGTDMVATVEAGHSHQRNQLTRTAGITLPYIDFDAVWASQSKIPFAPLRSTPPTQQ